MQRIYLWDLKCCVGLSNGVTEDEHDSVQSWEGHQLINCSKCQSYRKLKGTKILPIVLNFPVSLWKRSFFNDRFNCPLPTHFFNRKMLRKRYIADPEMIMIQSIHFSFSLNYRNWSSIYLFIPVSSVYLKYSSTF